MQVQVTSHFLQVLIDGGSRRGKMIMADDKLAAILVPVGPTEHGGNQAVGGWYLEAGFGPCSTLRVLAPELFESEAMALDWVARQFA